MTLVTTVQGEQVELEDDFGAQAAKAAEDHLMACWGYHHSVEDNEEMEGDSPAIGAFDGCGTCEVREMLYAAVPFLQAGLARDNEAPSTPVPFTLIQCPWKDEYDDEQ